MLLVLLYFLIGLIPRAHAGCFLVYPFWSFIVFHILTGTFSVLVGYFPVTWFICCGLFFHSSLSFVLFFIGLFVMDWKNEGSTKQANEKKMNKAQRIQYIFLCLLVLFLCLLSIKNKGKRRERAHALFNWKKDKEPTNN